MNAIIIEDEYLAAAELERLLGEVAPEITILTKLDSVSESVKWLKKNKADVIFMDIHLGDGQSFDIFEQVEITVPVIFITAYDEYALKAFKYQGGDIHKHHHGILYLNPRIQLYKRIFNRSAQHFLICKGAFCFRRHI